MTAAKSFAQEPAVKQPHTKNPAAATPAGPSWVRRLGGEILRHRRDLVAAGVAAVFGAACQVATPLVARQIVDGVIVAKTAALWPWLSLLIGLAVLAFVFSYLRRYRGGRLALGVQNDLRVAMHDRLQELDQSTLDTLPTGQLVARANSDTALVQGLLSFLPMVSGNLLMLLLSLVVMFVLSPLLALVSLAILPALLVVSYRMRQRVFPATWDGQQREGELAGIVDENIGGVRVVKAFGQEGRELRRLATSAGELYGSQLRAVRIQSRYQPVLESIPVIGQVGILALGGWLALNGSISLGTFLAFSTYIAQMMAPARQLAGILTIGQQARAGVERIFQLLDLRPAIADAPDAVDVPEHGEIRFDGVSFGYETGSETRRVLDGCTFTIRPGERVALVGASGSGKSTVVRMLLRTLDPDTGSVSIGGVDVRRMRLGSLRRAVGPAFEEAFLFSDSVRDNIAYGHPDASQEQIEAAARAAQAHEFVLALPKGYDTVVGERGLSLSGGQRQRIALARLLLRDPAALVLDDATSAVDSRTEERIHEALREAMADRTVLVVAHRHSTLRLADRILVLDGGRVVDEGRHEELIERSAVYRELFGDGESAEDAASESDAEPVAEPIVRAARLAAARRGEVEALAAVGGSASGSSAPVRARASVPSAPNLGMGLGGGGGRGGGRGMRGNLAPTPELLAKVAALPPIRDHARVDLAEESRQERDFSLRRLLWQFRRPLALALLFVVLDALSGLLGPAVVKTGIDDGVVDHAAGVLFAAAGVYLAITLIDLAVGIGESFVTGRTAQRIMLSLRIRIFAQLQRLSLDYYEREMAGRIMTRMTTDVDQFESLLQNGLLGALVAGVTFVGVGVALVVVDAPLGLAVLTVVVPLAVATVLFRRRAARLYDASRERIAVVNAAFQESLSGVREAQAFTHEAATKRHFRQLNDRYLESRVGAQRLVALYFPFVQFLSSVADVIVLGLGATLIAQGQLTAGALIAFLLYIDMFFSPIQQLSQVFDAWQQTRVSVGRIAELMRLETLTPEPAEPRELDGLDGAVTLDGVHFSYPTGPVSSELLERRGPQDARGPARVAVQRPTEALAGVEFGIRAGETVALVGETGAGKSTVMKLVARFYDPDRGEVRVDGTDLREFAIDDYRAQLGYVPQESYLFTGTVAENIAYGRPDASAGEIEAAARSVGAHEAIEALGGYDTALAERGRSLSAGQRQLIALARAELVEPAVLLLDEATANLDLASERRVTEAMHRLAAGRTTLLIAHRLQTAMTADRILVLAGGEVAEQGTHEELLATGGRYAAMWQAFELAQA